MNRKDCTLFNVISASFVIFNATEWFSYLAGLTRSHTALSPISDSAHSTLINIWTQSDKILFTFHHWSHQWPHGWTFSRGDHSCCCCRDFPHPPRSGRAADQIHTHTHTQAQVPDLLLSLWKICTNSVWSINTMELTETRTPQVISLAV